MLNLNYLIEYILKYGSITFTFLFKTTNSAIVIIMCKISN